MTQPIHVLFVCLGNICRSPMAEAVFRDMVAKNGLTDRISIDSAATSNYEVGNRAHHGTRQRLARAGIASDGLISRQINSTDTQADYIIGMDAQNMRHLHAFFDGKTSAVICRLLDFTDEPHDIADPWYTNDFDTTFDDVTAGCQALLTHIRQHHDI